MSQLDKRDMNYRVGQILYVILKREASSIYPMQVVEEITKKTLNGEETSYILRAGSDPRKTFSVSEIDGEIFDSSENAKKILIDRVVKIVSDRVDTAINKAMEWYPNGFEKSSEDTLSLIKKVTTSEAVATENQPSSAMVRREVAELAQELQEEADTMVVNIPDERGVPRPAKVRGVKFPPELS